MKARFHRIANQITNELSSSKESVKIAVAWFTNENFFEILIDLLNKGVKIEIITINDRINNHENGLDYNKFIDKGGEFYFSDFTGTMHHKFVIIDKSKLISGSYNWTYNAEYRNQENIIKSKDKELIDSFLNDFERLKINSIHQKEVISVQPKPVFETSTEKYIKEDLVYKSIDEEKKGELKKSIETLKSAKKFTESDDQQIDERISKIEEQIKNPEFHYHVEDGQFSFDMEKNYLIGKEGEIVKVVTDRLDDLEEIYILFVDGNYVECIDSIERDFPESKEEHDKLKNWTLEHYEG
jgi:phospholipase D-like protein